MAEPLDFSRLEAMCDGDPALKAELLGLFADTAGRCMEVIASNDATDEQWFAAVHELKGAAGALGFAVMAQLCEAMEVDGKADTETRLRYSQQLQSAIANLATVPRI